MEWKVTAKWKLRWAQSHQLANLQCYKNQVLHQSLLPLCLVQIQDFIHRSNTWQFLKHLSLKLHIYNIFLQAPQASAMGMLGWHCYCFLCICTTDKRLIQCLGAKRLTPQRAVLKSSIQPLTKQSYTDISAVMTHPVRAGLPSMYILSPSLFFCFKSCKTTYYCRDRSIQHIDFTSESAFLAWLIHPEIIPRFKCAPVTKKAG